MWWCVWGVVLVCGVFVLWIVGCGWFCLLFVGVEFVFVELLVMLGWMYYLMYYVVVVYCGGMEGGVLLRYVGDVFVIWVWVL